MREGSLEAPTRLPIDWKNPDFVDESILDSEMRRQFEICHGCRRCFNLCDSFPKLFDLIDEKGDEELDGVASRDFKGVVDSCTLCDMCYLTKCPYVPPHEFNIDFPHLMLRYRVFEKSKNKLNFFDRQITEIDRNGKIISSFLSMIFNWITKKTNTLTRKFMHLVIGIHKGVELPKFFNYTFISKTKKFPTVINHSAPSYGKEVVFFSTCFINYNEPSIGEAALKVLSYNGIKSHVVYPRCCGMPQLEQGDIKRVAENAEKTARELRPFLDRKIPIVSTVPSCTLMMKSEWPLVLPENKDVKDLSILTYDVSEFIVQINKDIGLVPGLNPLEGPVSLHLSCHGRAQNIGAKGAEMLRLIPNANVNVIERCSGHGGSWGVKKQNFENAMKFARGTIRKIKTNKPKYTCSECPLAAKHLSQGLKLNDNKNIMENKTLHPIQLLSKAYGLDN